MKNAEDTEKNEFPMRLAKFMASRGVASRRKCEEIIAAGRVAVNGEDVAEVATKIAENDTVSLDGGPPLEKREKIYLLLNKPRGFLCSAKDPHAEKTVFDLIDIPGERLFTVGRLDLDSEGLVILTNDGQFAEKIAHPKYGVLKRYEVKTSRPLSNAEMAKIRSGVTDDGEFLKPVSVERKKRGNGEHLVFILAEGKKREIRRLVAAAGAKVQCLRRVAVGKLELGKLPTGKWRRLSGKEARTAAKPLA